MTELGHNNPPPVDAMALHVDDLFALVSDSTASPIATDDQEAALDAMLDDVRKAQKDSEAQRKAEKKPHKIAGDAVDAAWKPITDKLGKAGDAIKAVLTPYRVARDRAKQEAARIAREEADRATAAAQEALQASDDLETRFAAEEQIAAAGKLEAQAKRIDRASTGLRTYWTAQITDRRVALNHYIARSPGRFEALIQQLADEDARGSRGAVPGITFHEQRRAA